MVYLDASALVKLIIEEAESTALRAALGPDLASSAIVQTELMRAVLRVGDDNLMAPAATLLDSIYLVALDAKVLRVAGTIDPPAVRALDAIHLATAAEFGNELEVILTYDQRMLSAAEGIGMDTWAPA